MEDNLLLQAARCFKQLLLYQYDFTVGYKGKQSSFTLIFQEKDFFHFAGFHKLTDVHFKNKVKNLLVQVLNGEITFDEICCSDYYENKVKGRLETIISIKEIIENNSFKVFEYNAHGNDKSVIKANYLITNQAMSCFVFFKTLDWDLNTTKQFYNRFHPCEKMNKNHTFNFAISTFATINNVYTYRQKELALLTLNSVTLSYKRFI